MRLYLEIQYSSSCRLWDYSSVLARCWEIIAFSLNKTRYLILQYGVKAINRIGGLDAFSMSCKNAPGVYTREKKGHCSRIANWFLFLPSRNLFAGNLLDKYRVTVENFFPKVEEKQISCVKARISIEMNFPFEEQEEGGKYLIEIFIYAHV